MFIDNDSLTAIDDIPKQEGDDDITFLMLHYLICRS